MKDGASASAFIARKGVICGRDLSHSRPRTKRVGLRVAIAIVIAAAAVAAAATTTASPTASRTGAPARAATATTTGIRSQAARIQADRRATVLHLHDVGRFVVSCDRDRRSAVTFVADHLLPSADIVVRGTRGVRGRMLHPDRAWAAWSRPAPGVAETWQIAPLAAAGVRVSMVHVTARRLPSDCAASALALTGPDQGPTRTAGRP